MNVDFDGDADVAPLRTALSLPSPDWIRQMRRLLTQIGLYGLLFAAVLLGTLPTSNMRLVRSVVAGGAGQEERSEEQSESIDVCRKREQLELSAPSDQQTALIERPRFVRVTQLESGSVEFTGHRLANGQLAAMRT